MGKLLERYSIRENLQTCTRERERVWRSGKLLRSDECLATRCENSEKASIPNLKKRDGTYLEREYLP